eukprot:403368509
MTSQNEDEFLKQIEEETKFITDYLDSQKLINSTLQQDIEPQVDLSNFSTHIQPTNKLENIYYMEVNFVQDINAQMLLQDKLINIANMGIVPSSVLLQIIESTMQTEDSNQHSLMYKIVRNAAQNQKIVPSDENEILEISDQEDLLEMLKISDTFKDLEVIVESKIELEGYTEYQIKVSEDLKYRDLFLDQRCLFITSEGQIKLINSKEIELELNTQLNQSYHLDNEINFTYQFLLNSQYRNHFKSVMNRTEDNLEYKYLFQNSQSFFGKKEQESVIAQRQVKNLLQAKGKCIFNDQDLNIYPMVKIIDEYITLDQQANNKIDFMRAVILLLKNSPLKNQQQFHKEFKQMLYNMTYTLFDFNKFRDLTQNYTQIPEQLLVKNQDLNVVESPEFNDEFVLQEIQLITEFHIICLFKIQQTDAKEMQKNMADIINVLNLKISQSLNVKYYYLLMKDLNKKNQLKKSLQVFKLLQTFQNIQDQHVFIELSQTLEISYLIIKSYLWAIKVNIMNNCEKEELEELMLKAEQNVEIYHKLMKQCVLNSDKGLDRYFIHLELVKLIQLYQEVLKEDIFDKQLPEIVKRVVYLKENDGSLKFIDKLSLIQIEVKIIESGYETTFNSTIEDIITQLKEIIITQSQKKPYKFLALSILFRIYLNNIDYQIFAFKLLDSFLVDDHNEANPNLNSSSLFKLQCAIIQFHQDQSQNDIDDSDSDSDSDLEAVEHIKSQAIFKDDTMLQKLIHSFIQADCIQRIGEKQELKEGANYYYQALMRYLCYGEMDYNKDVLEDVRNPKSLGEKVLNVVKYSQIRQNGNNQIE